MHKVFKDGNESDNVVVRRIINMGFGGCHSVGQRNLRLTQIRVNMEERSFGMIYMIMRMMLLD